MVVALVAFVAGSNGLGGHRIQAAPRMQQTTTPASSGASNLQGPGSHQNDPGALKQLRLFAEKGNADAQYELAHAYDDALYGVTRDYAEAMKWCRLAAAQGQAMAQMALGERYRAGNRGVAQDFGEALKWYRLAAAQGIANAQFSLGEFYSQGLGAPQDYAEAVKWFRLAAVQGHGFAQAQLGTCYRDGQGVAQNYVLALMWWSLAAANPGAGETRRSSVHTRDQLAAKMTAAQIAEAQELLVKCQASNYRNCG